jgi:uncharacterized membrane protein YphA (DoxX/SURF4 family)
MTSARNTSKVQKIIFWITTIVISIAFLVTGIGNLVPFKHIAQDMAHLGYPPYFLKILGTWKIIAAVIILIPNIPRVKEWAYAGMILDLTGAAFSRFAMADQLSLVLTPLCIAVLVTVNYILRRQYGII